MAPRWELFADILKVGVPGLINTAITNLSVVVLTGIAGQFGPQAAIGYAMGARLEYIMQPIAFGFGTAIVAMVGTNWGAQQYGRARRIAWTGAVTTAIVCGTIGLIVALQPAFGWACSATTPKWRAWRPVSAHRRTGLCVLRPRSRAVLREPRLRPWRRSHERQRGAPDCERRRGLAAVYGFDLGVAGFFAAVAAGFCLYAALLVYAVLRVRPPEPAAA